MWRTRLRPADVLQRILPLGTVLVLLALWQLIAMLEIYPPFIIPTPHAVAQKAVDVLADGRLWMHTQVTLGQVLMGLGIGAAAGVVLGYFIARSRTFEQMLSPIIIAFQATPVIAYAPLLVIWFGSGPESKIITSALIVCFPMLMNTVIGVRQVPPSLHDLMRAMQASRWQTFTRLEVPAAMPVLLGGLKMAATLSVIGAVVGEFVSARAGLGFLINVARGQYDTPLVIVSVFTLTLIAVSLVGLVTLVENRMLFWQKSRRH